MFDLVGVRDGRLLTGLSYMLSLYMIRRLTAVLTVGNAVAALGPSVATTWLPRCVSPLSALSSCTAFPSVWVLGAKEDTCRSSVDGLKCWISAAALTIIWSMSAVIRS